MSSTQQRYIYVVLTQTGTRIARIIKLFTRAPYNHTSISSDAELRSIYSFGRKHKERPLPSGFVDETGVGVFEMFNSIPCEIYAFAVTDEQFASYEAMILHFKRKNDHYGYNVLGLLALAFGIPVYRKTRFVCSQFVAYILTECRIASFRKNLCLVKPDDFRYLHNAKLVYKGDMKKFSLEAVLGASLQHA